MDTTNEARLDYFADMIEPFGEICADGEIRALLGRGKTRLQGVELAIRKHKRAVIKLLAALDETDAETYTVPGPVVLVGKLVRLFSGPEVQELFTGQDLKKDAAASGPAMANIEGGAN